METKEVDRVEALPVVRATSEVVAPRSRDDMLLMAMDRGYTPEQIAQFMDLRDRHEAREAEKAFNAAMADFKAQPPVIVKDKHVSLASQKGQTDYDHATHFSVTKAIAAALAAHGLSHSWKSEQRDGKIIVTCTVKHRLGHSESTAMEAAYDASGGKNAIQSIGSAKTYLERYTLLGITGLSTQDQPDDDGAGASAAVEEVAEKILDSLLENLKATTTDEAAAALWASGSKSLAATGSTEAYAEFKALVIKHREMLKGKKGGDK